jgi:hypothetical protein
MSSCCGVCGGQDAEEVKKQEEKQEQAKSTKGQVQQQEAVEQE